MILICGGAGYIGSHVNKMLAGRGYETVVFDNLVYGHKDAVKWGRFVEGDLIDKAAITRVFKEYPIDAVMHFAAYAYVGESVAEPAKYYRNNVVCSLNLLNAMTEAGCGRIIFSSSCTTYGEPSVMPITEDMPQDPVNPYGNTKYMVERIFRDYATAYGLKYVSLRYFNAAGADPEGEIGERHEPETHLIPLVLEAASGKRPDIKVYGSDYPTPDGTCIRDYIHVWDLSAAHVLALEHLNNGGASEFINLGNSKGASVLEVIETAKRVTGRDFTVTHAPQRPGDPPVLIGGNEKARRVLNWQPRYEDLDTIVKHAWAFAQK